MKQTSLIVDNIDWKASATETGLPQPKIEIPPRQCLNQQMVSVITIPEIGMKIILCLIHVHAVDI
ncbi:hypothetical protein SAMN05444972_102241 [Marininema halotolerans]|uniref:Uncharacterized protein n=1 Tax=Marininema halotolerans TaxID=1155944 RepID=A0A1I6PZD8_9BACL|nr:hypothetical protein SAMN05444972_102241 [Marininema halotolerans]